MIGKALKAGKLSYKRFVLETLVFISIGFVVGMLIGELIIWILFQMALITDTRTSNGAKKTSQGLSHRTKWGSKPDMSSPFVSKKSLNKYKKRYKGQGKRR